MKRDPAIHRRNSIRLQGYDYSQSGAYYFTMVTHDRKYLFGDVVRLEMQPNAAGKIVQWEWERLPQRFKFLELGPFILMPNHIHGIVLIDRDGANPRVGATCVGHPEQARPSLQPLHNKIPYELDGSPLPPAGPAPASLGAIIGQFKSRVTKRLWKTQAYSGRPVWQRNYYEHIIRNHEEFIRISDYIESNPGMWARDEKNPSNENGAL